MTEYKDSKQKGTCHVCHEAVVGPDKDGYYHCNSCGASFPEYYEVNEGEE